MNDKVELIFAALFAAWLLGVVYLVVRFVLDMRAVGRELDAARDGLDMEDK